MWIRQLKILSKENHWNSLKMSNLKYLQYKKDIHLILSFISIIISYVYQNYVLSYLVD